MSEPAQDWGDPEGPLSPTGAGLPVTGLQPTAPLALPACLTSPPLHSEVPRLRALGQGWAAWAPVRKDTGASWSVGMTLAAESHVLAPWGAKVPACVDCWGLHSHPAPSATLSSQWKVSTLNTSSPAQDGQTHTLIQLRTHDHTHHTYTQNMYHHIHASPHATPHPTRTSTHYTCTAHPGVSDTGVFGSPRVAARIGSR